MTDFERLMKENLLAVERFVNFKISDPVDAEDVLQEVLLSAFRNFEQLKSKQSFKSWVIGIARNKCSGYYRDKKKNQEIPVESFEETNFISSPFGYVENSFTDDVIRSLDEKDRQILHYAFSGIYRKLKLQKYSVYPSEL